MQTVITAKYLLLPVNVRAANKKVCLYDGETLLFDFNCRIDNLHPHFTAYIDVSAWHGRTVELVVDPDMPFSPRFSETMDLLDLWKEPLRPEVHFTVQNGWNNDPNGLVYFDGAYHMFYQYNPAAPAWDNMHWGHAVSRDLLHWEEKDVALFPDCLGTMFSGSAIVDKKNAAGFGENTMLLYYTAAANHSRLSAGQKQFTQCLAYSTDGKEFTKYAGNPIVPHIEAANRDPKVVYVEEIGRYIMALYRAEGRYQLLVSDDLLHWELFQEIALHGDAECPDLFALYCGTEKHWVLMGANDVYIVGHFEKDRFVIENSEKKLTYLKMSYAAQSFSDTPDGRAVRIAWHKLNAPAENFASQMSFPTEMHLVEEQEQYYLCASPIREIKQLYLQGGETKNIVLDGRFTADTGAAPLDVALTMPYTQGEKLVLNIFGTDIACDMAVNEIRCKNIKMPLSLSGDKVDLRILVDRCSVEIFADGGKIFAAAVAYADYNLPYLVLQKNEKLKINSLTWHTLANIHTKELKQ